MALVERQNLEDTISVAQTDLEKAKNHLAENHFDLTCLLSEQAVEKIVTMECKDFVLD